MKIINNFFLICSFVSTINVSISGLLATLLVVVLTLIIIACSWTNTLKDLPVLIKLMPMPGVKCPTCEARGIEQWVLPGKHCPRCSTACRVTNTIDVLILLAYLSGCGCTVLFTISYLFIW